MKQKIASGFARVFSAQPALPNAAPVSVECDIVKGLHAFTIVGLPDKSVEEAKDRLASAIKNSGLESPKRSNKKIVLSLAPAGLKKEGAVFDLPMALSFLLASEQVKFDPAGRLFAGELALDGEIRPIRGTLSIASIAQKEGFTDVYVPRTNADEAALISGLNIHPLDDLSQTLEVLRSKGTPHRRRVIAATHDDNALDDVRGQESAKRALVIAMAGGHNIALYGPPGTGKTMLARAAVSILPDLSEEEMIEVTTIHSLSGTLQGDVVRRPPLRTPHHTSSYASLIGGGSSSPRPGEVTLAHRGVLFLDEFPEFHRDVIQALREPLEDSVVSVARSKGSSVFPANFMLIAALNPCPCGYWGSNRCECMPHAVEKYRRKISGPIADRIDMWVTVPEIPLENLTRKSKAGHSESKAAREAVLHARERQHARFLGTKLRMNADMRARDIETHAALSDSAEKALVQAAERMKLSARGFHRTIKLARTIADLASSESIETPHMLEALQYRAREL
ncbi:YifB family Mg chelatase-like AAA ATPase [bacterium]|nr:YifB family Mg chelatase-like AAA ATPase [bacterium]